MQAAPIDTTDNIGIPDFSENIRLIVWDLDDTYWKGTVTEGGISYIDDHHNLVIELARRGIMSTICSKNDFSRIEDILKQKDIWQYFIFPSIDWTPKASRVEAQINNIGLRPPTVLFIDDNPQNLQQVLAQVPTINVAEPSIIPALLDHPRLKGKNDTQLTRLAEYKQLEQKKAAIAASGGSNIDFLRTAGVRVYIDYDVENNIDRAIELINRTNQLNFTKERLPEDIEAAKAELIPFLRQTGTEAALIRVVDNWGDHGYVGFYAKHGALRHFCFSCRTINMYIEHFVYNFIGRPQLEIVGEVVSDIMSNDVEIDWIEALPMEEFGKGANADVLRFERIYARGGCDLGALLHYCSMNSSNIVGEHNLIKNWQSVRRDHSAFLLAAIRGVSQAELEAAERIGYDASDFQTMFPRNPDDAPEVCLLSFWADANIPLYRHRETGLELPYWLIGTGMEDLTTDDELLDRFLPADDIQRKRIETLRREWSFIGGLTPSQMEDRYREVIRRLPDTTSVVMVIAHERHPHYYEGYTDAIHHPHIGYNRVIRNLANEFSNIILVDAAPYVIHREHILDVFHYQRIVYHKMYCGMVDELKKRHRRIVASAA